MSEFRILCYQSKFAEFKNHACEYISEMPAAEQDQFATVMALGADGAVGFDKTCEGRDTISSLVSKCYQVDLRNMSIQPHKKITQATCRDFCLEQITVALINLLKSISCTRET